MATREIFFATSLTGGGSGALDSKEDAEIADQDAAIVADSANNRVLFYTFDDSSAAAEVDPRVIQPDDAAGAGRWILTDIKAPTVKMVTDIQTDAGASVDTFYDDSQGDSTGDDDSILSENQLVDYCIDTVGLDTILKYTDVPGFFQRPKFEYKDADEIYIYAGGIWHHNGANSGEQILYNDGRLEFQITNGSGSGFIYIYLDDSDGISAPLAAGDLIDSETAPTHSATKGGWYNGEDRCIGAFYQTAANTLKSFYHWGTNTFYYDGDFTLLNNVDVDDSWQDVTTYTPFPQADDTFIGGHALVSVLLAGNNGAKWVYIRGGDAAAYYHFICTQGGGSDRTMSHITIPVDENAKCQVYNSVSDADTLYVYQSGYEVPNGV